jgi:hypothetical protein
LELTDAQEKKGGEKQNRKRRARPHTHQMVSAFVELCFGFRELKDVRKDPTFILRRYYVDSSPLRFAIRKLKTEMDTPW